MPDQHALLGQALGARGPDKVLALDLQHVRAQHSGVEADVQDRQRDPGENQALEPQHRALGELVIAQRRHPAEHGLVQAALGNQVAHLAEPEHRAGNPDQRQDHQDGVVERAAQPGGRHAHHDGHHDPDDRRPENQRQGGRRGGEDLGHDLDALIRIGHQIPADEDVLHHDSVLDEQRPVEPELSPYLGEHLRARVAPGDSPGRIDARGLEEDEEHDDRDDEHHQRGPQRPAHDKGQHGDHPRPVVASTATAVTSPPAASPAGRARPGPRRRARSAPEPSARS